MWMFLALLGALVSSSVMDLTARGEPAFGSGGNDDDPVSEDEPGNDGTVPLVRAGDAGGGDLLDHAETEEGDESGDSVPEPSSDPDPYTEPYGAEWTVAGNDNHPALIADGMPFEHPGDRDGGDPWLDGWSEDEYRSDDSRRLDPEGRLVRLHDDGGYLRGGAGDDTLVGGRGNDWIEGGEGDNLIIGGLGDDTLIGGEGQSTLIGGAGNDSLVAGGGPALMFGTTGDDHLLGGAHDDTLIGGDGNDTLVGGFGADLLVAGGGDNELNGGWGDDTLVGAWLDSAGRDLSGANTLNGGAGDDVLILGQGDLAHGGEGADSFVLGDWLQGGEPARIVDFTPGEDRIVLTYAEDGPEPLVELVHDPETGLSQVRVNGDVVAVVNDQDGTLSPADIELAPLETEPGGTPALGDVLRAAS